MLSSWALATALWTSTLPPPTGAEVAAASAALRTDNAGAIARQPLTALVEVLQALPEAQPCDHLLAAAQRQAAATLMEYSGPRSLLRLTRTESLFEETQRLGPIDLLETGYGAAPLPVPPGSGGAHVFERGWPELFRLVDDFSLPTGDLAERAEILQAALEVAYALIIEDARRLLGRGGHQSDLFVPNPTVYFADGAWVVPLQAGDFEEVKQEVAKMLTSVWSAPTKGHAVRILWTDATAHPEAYRLVVGTSVDGRDHVDPQRRELALHPLTTLRTIAHEFGHVLGLADRYHVEWQAEHCRYLLHLDYTDIMSNHMTGAVTDGEWAAFAAHYLPR